MLIGTTKNENGLEKLENINATLFSMVDACVNVVNESFYAKKNVLTKMCIEEYTKNDSSGESLAILKGK